MVSKESVRVCSSCGSKSITTILYGLPAEKPLSDVVLGGCVITDDDPLYACLDCKHRFGQTKKREHPDAVVEKINELGKK